MNQVNQDHLNNSAHVKVVERELRSSDESFEYESTPSQHEGTHLTGSLPPISSDQQHEVLVGVDPSLLAKDQDAPTQGIQEMEERSGMPMLSSRPKGDTAQSSTIDNMDLDQVMEDETVAGESAAVRRVGVTE